MFCSDENINFTLNLKKRFNEWKRIGALAPSSSYLAKKMATFVPKKEQAVIVELGSGTGSITRFLLQQMSSSSTLVAIEENSDLVDKLKETIHDPRLIVVCGLATDMSAQLQILGKQKVDCVVSGIPLGTLSESEREKILQSIVGVLDLGALYVQFQYFLASFGLIKKYFPHVKIAGYVLRNIPPAFVYVAKR